MDYSQYRSLRDYAIQALSTDTGRASPSFGEMKRLHSKLGCPSLQLKEEQEQAIWYWEDCAKTALERAAAHLLAVINNHYSISWWRATETPDGSPPREPLTAEQEDRLCSMTREAVERFIPDANLTEQQQAKLRGLVPVAKADTQPHDEPKETKETKEQRQDRRYQACIAAGLPMDKKAARTRLPDGVSKVAAHEGVTRQAFSADVKAAILRVENANREGGTARRT